MPVKSRQLHIRVTPAQLAELHEKADRYDVPLSRLVLQATHAYTRTYDAVMKQDEQVAINYAAWSRVDNRLLSLEQSVKRSERQLVRLRNIASRRHEEGTLSAGDFTNFAKTIDACTDALSFMSDEVDNMVKFMDDVSSRVQFVDNYLPTRNEIEAEESRNSLAKGE